MTVSRFNFRAYIKAFDKIYNVCELRNDGVLSIECIKEYNTILKRNDNEPELFLFKEGEFILMQSTGLTDKNGKEIFEGDIVKYVYPDGERIAKQIYCSRYDNCMYYANKDTYCYAYFYEIPTYEVEVIGNIYEDKELLNK